MDSFDPNHPACDKGTEEKTPSWESNDISQLVEAIKKRNAAARRPQDKQKSRSRKKVNEVLRNIFEK